MQVQPADFFSDQPPPRIIGTECEYNVQAEPYSNGKPIPLYEYISDNAISNAGFINYEHYLDNGGKLSVDVNHIEYGTPECLGPRQAAGADMAGMLVVAQVITGSELPHRGVFRLTGSFLPNKDSETNGYHENYLVPRSITQPHDDSLFDAVVPSFLASQTWAMSGCVVDRFVWSQKVWGIGGTPIVRRQERRTDRGQKPMCMVPSVGEDNDVLGDPRWARVERRYADAGLSPTARFLGLAAMSLTLRLIEHADTVGEKRLANLGLIEPTLAAKFYAADLTQNVTMETYAAKECTALDLQEEFATLALTLSERVQLPDDEQLAARLWLSVIDKCRQSNPQRGEYHDTLLRLLDAPARHHYLLQHRSSKKLTNKHAETTARSLLWDRILPHGGGLLWWASHSSRVVTPDDIQTLVYSPPQQTRASIRTNIIRNVNHHDIVEVDWQSVNYKHYGLVDLTDPYATISDV